jgi:calcineurin-like phosphoesterase
VQKEQIVQRFLSSLPTRFEAASNDVRLCSVLIDCDETTGRARRIDRIVLNEAGQSEESWQGAHGK